MSKTAIDRVIEREAAGRLAASFRFCQRVTKQRARNFYYGIKLMPEPKRSAMYALYGWMREADDLAEDTIGRRGEGCAAALTQFLAATRSAVDADSILVDGFPPGRLWPAVHEIVRVYRLPFNYLNTMIDGQFLDQWKTRYQTFDEVYDYCYKVASVVGLLSLEIWGYEGGDETRRIAEWRGIAFQLTNILRDVLEDAERDRVYLPAEDFGAYELSPLMFTMADRSSVIGGLRRVAERARDYYERSASLERRVHPDGRPCLEAMTRIYRGLLEKIARDPEAVLRGERVRLGKLRKGGIALRASLWRGWRI